MIENNLDLDTVEEQFNYEEEFVDSFKLSIKKIISEVDTNLSPKELGDANFCLVDIDGALISNNLVKLPFITHFVRPVIDQESADSFRKLVKLFDGSVVISTNRSKNEHRILNSKEVLKTVDNLIQDTGVDVPVFTGLYKQVPNLVKEDVSKEYLSKKAKEEYAEGVLKKSVGESLVHYIGKRVSEGSFNTITLYSIEDLSIVSLNRQTFLRYISKELKDKYSIDVCIRNFVIKR